MSWRSVAVCILVCGGALPAPARAQVSVQPPSTRAEIYDGAPLDIACGPNRTWLAEGRCVAVLDSATGARLGYDAQSPYANTVQAVEYDQATQSRFVATTRSLHVSTPALPHLSWQPAPGEVFPDFQDIKAVPAASKVFAVAGNRLAVFDYSSGSLVRVAQVSCPIQDVGNFKRLQVREVDGKWMAYCMSALVSPIMPRKFSLVIADLDSQHGFAQPFFHTNDWRAHLHYGDPLAGTRAVEVYPNLYGSMDVAVAADIAGKLTLLDVTNPAAPAFLSQIVPDGGCGVPTFVYNLLRDPTRSRLYVAGDDRLYIYEVPSFNLVGCTAVQFVDAGKRDMGLVRRRFGARMVWTAVPHSVEYALTGIDVTTATPVVARQQWWVSSSDGGVAAPLWSSIYLPTFAGVVRFDVRNETVPRPVLGSYQPANASTEHIEIFTPDPNTPDVALLVTATGLGGAQLWPVSQANPDPGPPQLVRRTPAAWGPSASVYQNDAEPYQQAGRNYVLADLSLLGTSQLALQAFDLATGASTDLTFSSNVVTQLTMDVSVAGSFAVVCGTGGFFVADLRGLPQTLSLASVQLVDSNGDGLGERLGSSVANAQGTQLFVATDTNPAVLSYAFDQATGQVSGPLCVYTGGLSGCVGRIRLYERTQRLYVPSRGGSLFEFDAGQAGALPLLSTWRSLGCNSELQDAQIYDFGHGPRILAVKNTECFALLDPEDGL